MPSTLRYSNKDVVLSIRLAPEIVGQLDELATEMERSRANLIARAVREYVEREYASLTAVREAEREFDEGKGVPHEQVEAMLDDLVAGKGRPEQFR
jgi:predicted transcriptional regulator